MLALVPKELMKGNIEHIENAYKEAGYSIKGELGKARTIMGIKGYTATLTLPNESPSFLFLGLRDKLAYEIQYQCGLDLDSKYNSLLLKMIEGIQLLDYANNEELAEFSDSNNQFSIRLPKSWSATDRDDGKVAQLWVSRELIINEDDTFKVGVTITKIRNASKNFKNVKSDLDLVKQWSSLVLLPSETIMAELHSFQDGVKISGKSGFMAERSIIIKGSDFYAQEYRIILAKNDDLYEIIMEAPVMEFEVFREVFNKAINSLVLY